MLWRSIRCPIYSTPLAKLELKLDRIGTLDWSVDVALDDSSNNIWQVIVDVNGINGQISNSTDTPRNGVLNL
ncbi:hypothetical protein WICPIJ_006478 [Wickerhamomyces pijperi]|uniref:Uncharacterized protein n=1 Tax=Wickerhamomyces pijperi TaxID=599730 RepID=A0A9P8TLD2_WICPI|nr:hypothetical protein WICPIJ_006478 [Wickerhamomyces pijperi]